MWNDQQNRRVTKYKVVLKLQVLIAPNTSNLIKINNIII